MMLLNLTPNLTTLTIPLPLRSPQEISSGRSPTSTGTGRTTGPGTSPTGVTTPPLRTAPTTGCSETTAATRPGFSSGRLSKRWPGCSRSRVLSSGPGERRWGGGEGRRSDSFTTLVFVICFYFVVSNRALDSIVFFNELLMTPKIKNNTLKSVQYLLNVNLCNVMFDLFLNNSIVGSQYPVVVKVSNAVNLF